MTRRCCRLLAAAVVVCEDQSGTQDRHTDPAPPSEEPSLAMRVRAGHLCRRGIHGAVGFGPERCRSGSSVADFISGPADFVQCGRAAGPGTRVVVEQNEASVAAAGTGSYMPDTTQPQFSGVTITDEAGGGAVSWHATTVASVFYGSSGYANGISQVDVYEADYWLANVLGVGNPTGPALARKQSEQSGRRQFQLDWHLSA